MLPLPQLRKLDGLLVEGGAHFNYDDLLPARDFAADARAMGGPSSVKGRTIADLVDFQDVGAHSELTRAALHERVSDGQVGEIATLSVPKPRGGQRKLVILDPSDELAWRTMSRTVATLVGPRVGDDVLSGHLHTQPPGWGLRSIRAMSSQRLKVVRSLADTHSGPVLLTDVHDHYGSCTVGELSRSTQALSTAPQTGVALKVIEAMNRYGQVRGLPIGPEASELYGTLILKPIDDAIRSHGVRHLRLTDDIIVYADSEDQVDSLKSSIDYALAGLGMARSEDKTKVVRADEVEDNISSLLISSVVASPGGVDPRVARWLWRDALESDPVDIDQAAFALGCFCNWGDSYPVTDLLEDRHLCHLLTKQFIRYLRILGTRRRQQHHIEPFISWLEVPVVADAPEYAIGLGVQRGGWGVVEGELLEKVTTSNASPAVRSASAFALSATPNWDLARAVDLIEVLPTHVARGLALGLRRRRNQFDVAKVRTHLNNHRPDIAAAIAWSCS